MDNEPSDYYISEAVQGGKQILTTVERLINELNKSGSEAEQLLAAGKIHEIRQAFHLARSIYQLAVQADPNIFEASVRLAILHLKEGESHRGLMLTKALEKKNTDFVFADISGRPRSLQTVLGDAYRDCGELDLASEAYRKALQLQPKDTHAMIQLAFCLVEQGEMQAALDLASTSMDRGNFKALISTAELLINDPNRLPAIGGIVSDIAFSTSFVV